jgi:hypothetical protein
MATGRRDATATRSPDEQTSRGIILSRRFYADISASRIHMAVSPATAVTHLYVGLPSACCTFPADTSVHSYGHLWRKGLNRFIVLAVWYDLKCLPSCHSWQLQMLMATKPCLRRGRLSDYPLASKRIDCCYYTSFIIPSSHDASPFACHILAL